MDMAESIAERLTTLRAQQVRLTEELQQVEPRRQYLIQELLKVQGAIAALESLSMPNGEALPA